VVSNLTQAAWPLAVTDRFAARCNLLVAANRLRGVRAGQTVYFKGKLLHHRVNCRIAARGPVLQMCLPAAFE
jgi:hypothetical protein